MGSNSFLSASADWVSMEEWVKGRPRLSLLEEVANLAGISEDDIAEVAAGMAERAAEAQRRLESLSIQERIGLLKIEIERLEQVEAIRMENANGSP